MSKYDIIKTVKERKKMKKLNIKNLAVMITFLISSITSVYMLINIFALGNKTTLEGLAILMCMIALTLCTFIVLVEESNRKEK